MHHTGPTCWTRDPVIGTIHYILRVSTDDLIGGLCGHVVCISIFCPHRKALVGGSPMSHVDFKK